MQRVDHVTNHHPAVLLQGDRRLVVTLIDQIQAHQKLFACRRTVAVIPAGVYLIFVSVVPRIVPGDDEGAVLLHRDIRKIAVLCGGAVDLKICSQRRAVRAVALGKDILGPVVPADDEIAGTVHGNGRYSLTVGGFIFIHLEPPADRCAVGREPLRINIHIAFALIHPGHDKMTAIVHGDVRCFLEPELGVGGNRQVLADRDSFRIHQLHVKSETTGPVILPADHGTAVSIHGHSRIVLLIADGVVADFIVIDHGCRKGIHLRSEKGIRLAARKKKKGSGKEKNPEKDQPGRFHRAPPVGMADKGALCQAFALDRIGRWHADPSFGQRHFFAAKVERRLAIDRYGLQAIKIDPGRDADAVPVGAVPESLMAPGLQVAVFQRFDSFPVDAVHRQLDAGGTRQIEQDRGRRIEWIGIIGQQVELLGRLLIRVLHSGRERIREFGGVAVGVGCGRRDKGAAQRAGPAERSGSVGRHGRETGLALAVGPGKDLDPGMGRRRAGYRRQAGEGGRGDIPVACLQVDAHAAVGKDAVAGDGVFSTVRVDDGDAGTCIAGDHIARTDGVFLRAGVHFDAVLTVRQRRRAVCSDADAIARDPIFAGLLIQELDAVLQVAADHVAAARRLFTDNRQSRH